MATLKRYKEGVLSNGGLASARSVKNIRAAVKKGKLSVTSRVVKEGERLDQIAHDEYGDARLWWVIAAASSIGWWMQIPAGTFLKIPTDLSQVDSIS